MRNGSSEAIESDRLDGYPHPRERSVLIGHPEAERDMLQAFRANRLPHAWLIGGPEGIGKATLAWRFARFVLANPDPAADAVRQAHDLAVPERHPVSARIAAGADGDIAVLRRERNDKTGRLFTVIRVDEVRRASSLFQQASGAGGYRICILDSAEDLNLNSANALLKLIEEPPSRSLFLIVAHRPAQVLPTLRSRCRALMLSPPSLPCAVEALRSLGPPLSDLEEDALTRAAIRAGQSVAGALHWLSGDRLSLDRDARQMLERLPEIDWRALHGLADRIGDEEEFDVLLATVLDWLHERVLHACGPSSGPVRRLAPLAEVWDKVRRSARDAEILNLDKRTTLFSIFADLAQANRPL